jgi:hypothetical protein
MIGGINQMQQCCVWIYKKKHSGLWLLGVINEVQMHLVLLYKQIDRRKVEKFSHCMICEYVKSLKWPASPITLEARK